MFLGFEDSLKTWRKELRASGADMSVLKEWQKAYDKVKRQTPQMESQYIHAKKELEAVYILLQNMEKTLVEWKEQNVPAAKSELEKKILDFSNEMKKYQDHFHHEFLVGKDDTEFHLTYKTLLELCTSTTKDVLIMHSEVENLLALCKEALDKEWPGFRAMAFYYIHRSDREIFDLPHSDKVEKANRVYENEFLKPMRQILTNCYGDEKARQILEVDLWN